MVRGAFASTNLRLLACALSLFAWGCGGDETSSSGQTSSSSGGGPITDTKIAINEINAIAEDWVEIGNAGALELDLSGIGITDQIADGTPSFAETMRFPAGVKLAPGSFLLIRADLKTPLAGEQTMCLTTGGPPTCYQAGWGISDAKGDKLFLLSEANEILSEVAYPATAVTAGQTYGRIPNGVGNFVACEPTPGEANKAAP